MKITQSATPFYLSAAIQRMDEEKRTITAYAFVNEVVEGEGGIRLKRSAMEAATPDYMKWANIRRMHQPDAVGVAESVDWDEKGALMTLRVVDDDAWNKCKEGVYKALSIGVMPTHMRGKEVEVCSWKETSLVDRPKDPGSKFIALRADGVEIENDEIKGEVEIVIRTFADMIPSLKKDDVTSDISSAYYAFLDCVWDILYNTPEGVDKKASMQQSIQEFSAYLTSLIEENAESFRAAVAQLKRATSPPDEVTKETLAQIEERITQSVLVRFEEREEARKAENAANVEALVTVQGLLTRAEERIETLEKMPMPIARPPVQFPEALERTFLANQTANTDLQRVDALLKEKAVLMDKAKSGELSEEERNKAATRVMVIEGVVASLTSNN